MTTKLVITPENELQEVHQPAQTQAHPALRAMAHFFSYIFHPVFVPVYVVAILLFIEPYLFIGASPQQKIFNLLRAIVNYTFFPLISVALLKALNFISSIKLKERKDRIIPFIVCNIWYFWIWYVWRGLPEIPRELVLFSFSVFMASSIGMLFNIYLKISMHGIALGTTLSFLCYLSFYADANLTVWLALATFITGLVCTSRLILAEHTPAEVYWGIAVGLLAVIISYIVVY